MGASSDDAFNAKCIMIEYLCQCQCLSFYCQWQRSCLLSAACFAGPIVFFRVFFVMSCFVTPSSHVAVVIIPPHPLIFALMSKIFALISQIFALISQENKWAASYA